MRDRFLIKPGPLNITLAVLPGHTVPVQMTHTDQFAGGACISCSERTDDTVVSPAGLVVGEVPTYYGRWPVVHVACEDAWLSRIFPASDTDSSTLLADYRHREKIAQELDMYSAEQEAHYNSLPEDEQPNYIGRTWASDALDEASRVIRFGYELASVQAL